LSREAVTIYAVDRHPGITGIFDASLNYRQTSKTILLEPSMVANCLSLLRALYCQLERIPSSSQSSLLSGGSPLL
jgi:hypothetical protein